MTKILLTLSILLFASTTWSQISGIVSDPQNNPLPFVNVYIENSYNGTTTNDKGNYKLDTDTSGKVTVVFQFLGFKTQKKEVNLSPKGLTLNISLEPETFSLDQVVIATGENPANRIVKLAIENRKENLAKIKAYTADFYSRGLWKMKDVPVKIMGQEVGDFDGALDSTRTGIVYLSETISKIAYQKPNDFFEQVIASKVSGNDNGFSFNSARDANFSFYENTININAALISPIANNAFNYYNYQLDGVFYENNQLINKIKVSPKRPNDRIFSGTIYIVEDNWQLYGIDLTTTGNAIQVPFIEQLAFKQNFSFDEQETNWVKRSQTIDFVFGLFGFKGDGRFTAVYSNYNFNPAFDRNTFSNEILYFEPQANKKDSLYWEGIRPVPLTDEEVNDYQRRDSLQSLRKSKKYLDSIDLTKNKIGLLDPILGYTYANTYKKWRLGYEGLFKKIHFNTLQGWHLSSGLTFNTWYDENKTKTLAANVIANYGFEDDKLRITANISKRFNRIKRNTLSLSGGKRIQQFNASEPISPLINTVSSLFFERNFLKAYDLTFATLNYSQELVNGLSLLANVGFEKRQPLFNQSDQVTIRNKGVSYTSNNPLAPNDFENAGIDSHHIWKSTLGFAIRFGQKYLTYPDGKFNVSNSKYPALNLFYIKGFGASNKSYNFDQLHLRILQNIDVSNKGSLSYNFRAGTFINAAAISFADYQHFNGNQTRVNTSQNYTNVFNLLPYYALSTNGNYLEGHLEHNFKGFVLGKLPLINKLNFNLVAGAHFLSTENNKPYSEFSIGLDNLGFGKFRFLRLDYVRSLYEGKQQGAFIFGLQFLNFVD